MLHVTDPLDHLSSGAGIYSWSSSFFFTNDTGAPHGEVLGRMNYFPNNSLIWLLSSTNSTGAIR